MTMRLTIYSAFLAAITILASGCCVDQFGGRAIDCHDGGCGIQDACNECCDGACGKCCGPGPIHALKSMFHGAGCCGFYLDEWISNPPYRCDPCDDHGHFVGPRCCAPKLPSWKRFFGQRGGGCSCHACLQRPGFHHDGEFIEGEIIEGGVIQGEVIYDGPVTDEASEPAESSQSRLRPTPVRQISTSQTTKSVKPRSHKVYYKRAASRIEK